MTLVGGVKVWASSGREDLGEGGLALMPGGKAALDRAAAFLGLGKLAAAARTALPGLALQPEAPPADLAALGFGHAHIDDVLVASLASPADMTAHAVPP